MDLKKFFAEYRTKKYRDEWKRASKKARKSEIQAEADCRKVLSEDIHREVLQFRLINGAGVELKRSHIGRLSELNWYEVGA